MSLVHHAFVDIGAQRDALVSDLAFWNKRSRKDGDLPQHHRQIARISTQIEGALDQALRGTALGRTTPAPKAEEIERPRRVVEILHLVWDFFRDKLTQRDSSRYSTHLGAADDLAWECYLPFAEARVAAVTNGAAMTIEQLKEPPLVFYAPDRSPFAQARASAFAPPGLRANDVHAFSAALQHLPVPLVAIPWSQSMRAPSLVFVAHEVGHVVADDLGVAEEASQTLAALGLEATRTATWQRWLPEVFADVFGVAALGTAYVDQLATLLASDLVQIRAEKINSASDYPTRSLRLSLAAHALERLELTPYRSWTELYGPLPGESRHYDADVPRVTEALLGPFAALNGKSLRELLKWDAKEEKRADTVASDLVVRGVPPIPFSVRRWIAGAARAHRRDPAGYQKAEVDAEVAAFIVGRRGEGVRSDDVGSLRDTLRGSAGTDDLLTALDRRAGADLVLRMGL